MDWSGVDYCDVFISCLNSHSDGTHSLQRIYWWASDVMGNFSISEEETNSSTSWVFWGWVNVSKLSFLKEQFLYYNSNLSRQTDAHLCATRWWIFLEIFWSHYQCCNASERLVWMLERGCCVLYCSRQLTSFGSRSYENAPPNGTDTAECIDPGRQRLPPLDRSIYASTWLWLCVCTFFSVM